MSIPDNRLAGPETVLRAQLAEQVAAHDVLIAELNRVHADLAALRTAMESVADELNQNESDMWAADLIRSALGTDHD